MKPAAPGDTQPLRPAQPPLRLLRWQARTQVFYEELGNGARLTMVRIPAGSFQMGSAEQEPGRHANEGPLHEVTLAEFLIGQTPITQAQWRAVARWQERPSERWGREMNPEPSRFQGEEARLLAGETNTDGRPVERVSWLDAIEFCSRLSQRTKRTYTLPSEAQWEYACRAGTSTAFHFGPTILSDLANFKGTNPSRFHSLNIPDPQPLFRETTTPVGMFPANSWGLYDMHGNVWEWCLDSPRSSYEGGPYDGSAWQGPQPPKEQQRITRGGSWNSPPKFCRSAFRSPDKGNVKDGPYDDAGFRVACLPKSVSGMIPDDQELNHEFDTTALDSGRSNRRKIILCHTSQDDSIALEFRIHLDPLFHLMDLSVSDDSELFAGRSWHEDIWGELKSTIAVIVLVSQGLLDSDHARSHHIPAFLEIAESRKTPIYCLYLEHSVVDQLLFFPSFNKSTRGIRLTDYQGLNSHVKPLSDILKRRRNTVLRDASLQVYGDLRKLGLI
jgi:formylglycine-generating enzyme required for sulfatase activity